MFLLTDCQGEGSPLNIGVAAHRRELREGTCRFPSERDFFGELRTRKSYRSLDFE
jgi:hypothetical protein